MKQSEHPVMVGLPQVGGEVMSGSLVEFERRCRLYLEVEQSKLSPDNCLIALLCDAVRLSREYGEHYRNALSALTTGPHYEPRESASQPTIPEAKE